MSGSGGRRWTDEPSTRPAKGHGFLTPPLFSHYARPHAWDHHKLAFRRAITLPKSPSAYLRAQTESCRQRRLVSAWAILNNDDATNWLYWEG